MRLERFGIKHLVSQTAPRPVPGPGEVLIRVRAASLNQRDLRIIEGRYLINQRLPLIPISDCVGEVVDAGPGVEGLRAGDRVSPNVAQTWLDGPAPPDVDDGMLGGPLDGVLREYAVFPHTSLLEVPDHLSDEEAAAFPCAAVTAWYGLVALGQVRAGQTVLVQGTGGVSLFALQFAVINGARAIVISSRTDKLERVRALGAWQTIDRSVYPDWHGRARELTDGVGVDQIVDVVGDLDSSVLALRHGGSICQVGYLATTQLTTNVMPFLSRNVTLRGVSVGPRAAFADLNRAVGGHRLRPVLDRSYHVEEVRHALLRLKSERHMGKITLTMW